MELSSGSNQFIWATPYYYKYEVPDENGSPLPKLNIDLRTIFRIRQHCQFINWSSRVAALYLTTDAINRMYIYIEDPTAPFTEVPKIIDIISGGDVTAGRKYSLVPLFKLDSLPISRAHLEFLPKKFRNIELIEGTFYLNLDAISNTLNFPEIYFDISTRFYAMMKEFKEKFIITGTKIEFMRNFNFTSYPETFLTLYVDILENVNNLYIPSFLETYEFWLDRLSGKRYYLYIGASPIVAHSIALMYPIWIINNVIELPMNNEEDYSRVSEIRKLFIIASGSVYKVFETDTIGTNTLVKAESYKPLSIASYRVGIEKKPVLSLLFPINKIPPDIEL
jgi:hypothetical protein